MGKRKYRLPIQIIGGKPVPPGTKICEHRNPLWQACGLCADECQRRASKGDRDHDHPYERHCHWGVHEKE